MNNILFITAYLNINRENWSVESFPRDEETYLSYFENMINNIKYNLVVFLEQNLIDKLESKYRHYTNVFFLNINIVDTFYKKYLEIDKKIINSEIYKNKIPEHRKDSPEHLYSEYNLINHSKINFVKKAYDLIPKYNYYSWIDFGMIRENNLHFIPRNIDIRYLSKNKVTYQAFCNPPEKKINANEMLKKNDIFIAGSSFIIPNLLISKFEKLWEEKIIEWQSQNITDDDQNLILQLYFDNNELFDLKISKIWFNLYNILTCYVNINNSEEYTPSFNI